MDNTKMSGIRLQQRWVSWYWGLFGGILAVIFGGIGLQSLIYYPEEKPSVRVVIPLYGLAVYWVLACAFNKQTAEITPEGLRVRVRPFPVRSSWNVKRDKLVLCYFRKVTTTDNGTPIEAYYSAGVETGAGDQIDVSSPHWTSEAGRQAAEEVAAVLNQDPSRTPIPVRLIPQLPSVVHIAKTLLLALLWLALLIGSIFLGFFWEEVRGSDYWMDVRYHSAGVQEHA